MFYGLATMCSALELVLSQNQKIMHLPDNLKKSNCVWIEGVIEGQSKGICSEGKEEENKYPLSTYYGLGTVK